MNGMPLSTTRQYLLDYTMFGIWNNPSTVDMETEIYTTSMVYDALGRPVTVTAPDGGQTHYQYQDSGLLYNVAVTGVHSLDSEIVNEVYYDAKGQRLKVKYENGSTTTYAYDPYTFRVTNIRTTRSSDSNKLQDLKYWYDPVGNITLQTDEAIQDVYFNNTVVSPDNDYTYDALYRLIIASGRENAGNGGAPTFNDSSRMGFAPLPANPAAMQRYTEKYTYDEVGNMLQMRHIAPGGSGWTRTFTIDATSNRTLSNSIGSNDPVLETYTYDNAGNITGGFNHMPYLSYDYCNRLNLIGSDDMSDSYQYDRNGQRIRKTSFNGSTVNVEMRKYIGQWEDYIVTKFFVGYLVSQRQTLNISDDTGRIALIDTPIVDPTGSEVQLLRYQYSNHLGTATLELAYDAAIISYEEYYPYGSTSYQSGRSAAETSLKRYRYIGKERDEITGFYYMGARYYVSWMARWIAVDPLQAKYTPESSYNYCHNNPVGWTDRTGMGPGDEEKPKITPAIVMVSGSSTQLNTTPAKQPSKPAPKPIPHNKQIDVPEDDPESLKPKPEPVKSPTDYVPETQYLIPDPQGHGHVWTASQIQKGIAARDEQTGNNIQFSFTGAMFYWAGSLKNKDVADKASDFGAAIGQLPFGAFIAGTLKPINNSISVKQPFIDKNPNESVIGQTTYYRAMNANSAETFRTTGVMPSGAETMISPTLSYIQGYRGKAFEITVRPYTYEKLVGIGVRDNAKLNPLTSLPLVSSGWMEKNAFFKIETNRESNIPPQLNIGLGYGSALNIFNRGIVTFKKLN